jgi:hypothetical protein
MYLSDSDFSTDKVLNEFGSALRADVKDPTLAREVFRLRSC